VCKQAVKEASLHAKKNQIDDEDILSDAVENLCSASKDEGKWTMKIDIIAKEGSRLGLDRRDEEGTCKNECKAVQKACSAALKGREEKLVSQIRDRVGIGKLQKEFCQKPCNKDLPDLKKWTDEAFEPAKPAMPDPPKVPPIPDPPSKKEAFAPLMSDIVSSLLQEFGSTATASDFKDCFMDHARFEEFLEGTTAAIDDMMKKELAGMRSGLHKFGIEAAALAGLLQDFCPDSKTSATRMKALAHKLEEACKDNSDAIEYKAMELLKVSGHDLHKPLNAFLNAWNKESPDAAAFGQTLAKFFQALESDVKERSDL
jgi:hypothetical protein